MEFTNHVHAPQGNGGNLGYIYMECTKNQSVSVHQHSLDGCGEFWPGGELGTVEALLCAACQCHRNFHRKVAVGQPVVRIHKNNQMTGPTWFYHPSPSAFVPVRPSTVANNHGPVPVPSASMENVGEASNPSPSRDHGRRPQKRPRTNLTKAQKGQMLSFAQELGWRIQKEKEVSIHQFCVEIGINKKVFRIWMNNNKRIKGSSFMAKAKDKGKAPME